MGEERSLESVLLYMKISPDNTHLVIGNRAIQYIRAHNQF